MAKARSPQYPAVGLKEAVERVGQVYGRDYQNSLPREIVAQHMGYQGLNGKSLGLLSALSKYGLLEGRGDETRVTDLAVRIIAHAPGTSERGEALREAASSPELFGELDARFAGGKASDQAIRAYLLTQRFIPSAADAALRAYRETKTFVDSESGGYDLARIEPEQPVEQKRQYTPGDTTRDLVAHGGVGPLTATGILRAATDAARAAGGIAGANWRPPSEALSEENPYELSVTKRGIEVAATLRTLAALDELQEALEAYRPILKRIEAKKPSEDAPGEDSRRLSGPDDQ